MSAPVAWRIEKDDAAPTYVKRAPTRDQITANNLRVTPLFEAALLSARAEGLARIAEVEKTKREAMRWLVLGMILWGVFAAGVFGVTAYAVFVLGHSGLWVIPAFMLMMATCPSVRIRNGAAS